MMYCNSDQYEANCNRFTICNHVYNNYVGVYDDQKKNYKN